jgi:hypothetical protein
MDREMLKRHLAQAEEHIATGDKNIARQRAYNDREGATPQSGSGCIIPHEKGRSFQ